MNRAFQRGTRERANSEVGVLDHGSYQPDAGSTFILGLRRLVDRRAFMNEQLTVLMAEDNTTDILITRRLWDRNKIANPLYVVEDGSECLDYLYRRKRYADPDAAPKPGILLLDINMPRIGGIEVLKQIRVSNEPEIRNLRIIMLTDSTAEEDKLKSYDEGATAYMVKPVEFEDYGEFIEVIRSFWELVELP